MASPIFNGNTIFDSIASDGMGGTIVFSEGMLWAGSFSPIRQPIHFNGENGIRYLNHGYPDREWTFEGIFSAPDLPTLQGIVVGIQDAIVAAQEAPTVYYQLTDSMGIVYNEAQVTHYHPLSPMQKSDDGYLIKVRVQGIIQGMIEDS